MELNTIRHAPVAPWFCSFRLWRFINHLLSYLLTNDERKPKSSHSVDLHKLVLLTHQTSCSQQWDDQSGAVRVPERQSASREHGRQGWRRRRADLRLTCWICRSSAWWHSCSVGSRTPCTTTVITASTSVIISQLHKHRIIYTVTTLQTMWNILTFPWRFAALLPMLSLTTCLY